MTQIFFLKIIQATVVCYILDLKKIIEKEGNSYFLCKNMLIKICIENSFKMLGKTFLKLF